jgi:hypothetical protein
MRTPFVSLISKSWAQSSGNLDTQMVADPEHFTIFSLPIPNHNLDPRDLDYLADNEDSDDETAPSGVDDGGNTRGLEDDREEGEGGVGLG